MAVSRKTLKKLRGQRQKATRKGYVSPGSHISKKGVVIKNRGRQTGTRGIGANPKGAGPTTGNTSGHTGVASGVETYARATIDRVTAAMRKRYGGSTSPPPSSAAVTAAFKKKYR